MSVISSSKVIAAMNRNTGLCVDQQTRAARVCLWVPVGEIFNHDAILRRNLNTRLARLYEMKLVAILDRFWLSWLWGGDSYSKIYLLRRRHANIFTTIVLLLEAFVDVDIDVVDVAGVTDGDKVSPDVDTDELEAVGVVPLAVDVSVDTTLFALTQ